MHARIFRVVLLWNMPPRPQALTVPSSQANTVLGLSRSQQIEKLRNAGLLVGPDTERGGTKIYASSLETAAAVLPTSRADGDIVFGLDALVNDPHAHAGRAWKGWHQQRSLALPLAERRLAWSGVWLITLTNAMEHVGHHAVATISGFVVDAGLVTDASICSDCTNNVIFELAEPEAFARYHDRRSRTSPKAASSGARRVSGVCLHPFETGRGLPDATSARETSALANGTGPFEVGK
jgi:hypothetical protein